MIDGESSQVESDEHVTERPARWRTRLFMTATVLATAGTLLTATYVGWWLHDRNPGRPVTVAVNRPIRVVKETGTAPGIAPNVLGLDVDTARQAMADAGVDPGRITVREQPYAGERKLVIDQDPGPGTPRTDNAVLSISAPATMPVVLGRQVDDVRKRLGDLGARVLVQTRFAGGQKEGNVLSTRPAAGRRLTSETTLTVAEAPSSVFLTQLQSITSDCSSAELNLDGRSFKNALSCSPGVDSPSGMEFALNRRVSRLVATAGIDDRSAVTAPVRFRVLVDGRTRFVQTVAFGSTARIDVPVAGALRVRLQAQLASRRGLSDSVTAAWGNARFLGGRGAIDALVKESAP